MVSQHLHEDTFKSLSCVHQVCWLSIFAYLHYVKMCKIIEMHHLWPTPFQCDERYSIVSVVTWCLFDHFVFIMWNCDINFGDFTSIPKSVKNYWRNLYYGKTSIRSNHYTPIKYITNLRLMSLTHEDLLTFARPGLPKLVQTHPHLSLDVHAYTQPSTRYIIYLWTISLTYLDLPTFDQSCPYMPKLANNPNTPARHALIRISIFANSCPCITKLDQTHPHQPLNLHTYAHPFNRYFIHLRLISLTYPDLPAFSHPCPYIPKLVHNPNTHS